MPQRMSQPLIRSRSSQPAANRWCDPGGAGRWQGGADGATVARDTTHAAGQGAKTHQKEGSRRDQPLYHCPLSTYPPGSGGGLLTRGDRPATATRPVPVGKELRATLEGKEVAVTRLAQRASQREGPYIQHRVALTDGAEALQGR